MALLVNVADGCLGEVAGGNVALAFSHDGHVRWGWHDTLLVCIKVGRLRYPAVRSSP
jgi:hypothetical protein